MATKPMKPEHKEHIKLRTMSDGLTYKTLRSGNRIFLLSRGFRPGERIFL